MRENIKISKIHKKRRKKTIKKTMILTKKIANVLYLLDKYIKVKVHKNCGASSEPSQIPTFM